MEEFLTDRFNDNNFNSVTLRLRTQYWKTNIVLTYTKASKFFRIIT